MSIYSSNSFWIAKNRIAKVTKMSFKRNKLVHPHNLILFSNKKEWVIKPHERHGWIWNVYCWVKEASLKKLRTNEFIYMTSQKRQNYSHIKQKTVSGWQGVGVGRGWNRWSTGNLLVWWDHSVWYRNGGYKTLQLSKLIELYSTKSELNVCKFWKSFRRLGDVRIEGSTYRITKV